MHTPKSENALTESLEMYLKIIYRLIQEKKVARVKDISDRLDVKKSSVSNALKQLSERGFVEYDPYSFVELTEKGRTLARVIVKKDQVLRDFLVKVLGINPDVAEENACRMEHVIDNRVFEGLVDFVDYVDFVKICPIGDKKWMAEFQQYRMGKKMGKPH